MCERRAVQCEKSSDTGLVGVPKVVGVVKMGTMFKEPPNKGTWRGLDTACRWVDAILLF